MRSIVNVFMLFIAVSACALDPAKDPPPTGINDDDSIAQNVSTLPTAADNTPAAEPLSPTATGATPAITSGCAHVVWCDQPDSSIGTVCHQDGCTLSQAKTECYADVQAIGCQFHCPGRIEVLGGGTSSMCCPGVCSSGCPC